MTIWRSHKRATLAGLVVTLVVVVTVVTISVLTLATPPTAAQAPTAGMPRTSDGKPNLSGIWQANNSANWNILAHQAHQGPVIALGAAYSIPGGTGVVEGN